MNKTDIKIEEKIQFDYKEAIEEELNSFKEKIKEYEEYVRYDTEIINQYENKVKRNKKRIEEYRAVISGLQIANSIFDEWIKNQSEV